MSTPPLTPHGPRRSFLPTDQADALAARIVECFPDLDDSDDNDADRLKRAKDTVSAISQCFAVLWTARPTIRMLMPTLGEQREFRHYWAANKVATGGTVRAVILPTFVYHQYAGDNPVYYAGIVVINKPRSGHEAAHGIDKPVYVPMLDSPMAQESNPPSPPPAPMEAESQPTQHSPSGVARAAPRAASAAAAAAASPDEPQIVRIRADDDDAESAESAFVMHSSTTNDGALVCMFADCRGTNGIFLRCKCDHHNVCQRCYETKVTTNTGAVIMAPCSNSDYVFCTGCKRAVAHPGERQVRQRKVTAYADNDDASQPDATGDILAVTGSRGWYYPEYSTSVDAIPLAARGALESFDDAKHRINQVVATPVIRGVEKYAITRDDAMCNTVCVRQFYRFQHLSVLP